MINENVYINGRDLHSFGAQALRDYTVGGTEITSQTYQGRDRTHFTNIFNQFGMKPISFTVVFTGQRRREVESLRSALTAELYGVSEITLPDEFTYRCVLESVGDGEWKGQEGNQWLLLQDYSLKGIQHDALVSVADGRTRFYVRGTMPQMDARLTMTVPSASSSVTFCGADFGACSAGDVLVFDGIEKRLMKNGAPAKATGYFEFPFVTPEWNNFTGSAPIKVEYFPCYI